MVYWILANDSDQRFEDEYDIREYLCDELSEEANDQLYDHLDENYSASDIWYEWNSRNKDPEDYFCECEDNVWNNEWEESRDEPGETFELFGVEFICMEDDEDDELMAEEEEE